MPSYKIAAGIVVEPSPCGQVIINASTDGSRFDFNAAAVAVDAAGFVEVRRPGFRHPAARTCGRETKYKPELCNIAPRPAGWTKGGPAAQ